MKQKVILLLVILLSNIVFAQFTLDNKIKPITLQLKENSTLKGAKGIALMDDLAVGETRYFTVKGHDIFEFIDVYVFTNNANSNLNVDIVVNNWSTPDKSKNTKNETDEIANFKFQTVSSFGIKISSNLKEIIPFSIVISATPPVKNYLNSPFRKIKASDKINTSKETNNTNAIENSNTSAHNNNSTLLYVVIGLLIIIILLLAFKNKKSKINVILFIITLNLTFQNGFSQNTSLTPAQTYTLSNMLSRIGSHSENAVKKMIRDQMQSEGRTPTLDFQNTLQKYNTLISRIKDVQGKLNTATNVYNSTKELYNSYENLSSCINNTPLPGLPKVPSFCVNNQCKSCFTNAREQFNELRYKFEKLQAIYACTKQFSNAAISFGDNASGVHALTGLAWQTQRIEIQKSVKGLEKAYTKKRAQFLRELQSTLQELNNCEAQYGLPDWYDRFGYLIYDFIEMKYHK